MISLCCPCDCLVFYRLLWLFSVLFLSVLCVFIIGKMQDGNTENNQTKGNLLSLKPSLWFLTPPWRPSRWRASHLSLTSVFAALSLRVPPVCRSYWACGGVLISSLPVCLLLRTLWPWPGLGPCGLGPGQEMIWGMFGGAPNRRSSERLSGA